MADAAPDFTDAVPARSARLRSGRAARTKQRSLPGCEPASASEREREERGPVPGSGLVSAVPGSVVYTLGGLRRVCARLGSAAPLSRQQLASASVWAGTAGSERRFGSCAVVGASGMLLERPELGREIDGAEAVWRLAKGRGRLEPNTTGMRTSVLALRGEPELVWPKLHLRLNRSRPEAGALLVRQGAGPLTCAHVHALALVDANATTVLLMLPQLGKATHVELAPDANLTSSWWSTGAAMMLAALAMCNSTTAYGFDPGWLNCLTAHERAQAGWWPYHWHDKVSPPASTVHDFVAEYAAFCGMCGRGRLEYAFPQALTHAEPEAHAQAACQCKAAHKPVAAPPGRMRPARPASLSTPPPTSTRAAGRTTVMVRGGVRFRTRVSEHPYPPHHTVGHG